MKCIYVLTCRGCGEEIADEKNAVVRERARESGWVLQHDRKWNPRCPNCAIPYRCATCDNPMRPHGRLKEQFPSNWVAKGTGGDCTSCTDARRRGSSATRRLERAVDAYYAFRTVELQELVEMTDREELERLAAKQLDDMGASDIKEILRVGS